MKRLLFISLLLSIITLQAQDFSGVDHVINNSIQKEITPGAALIVGNDSEILYQKAYGRFTYDDDSPEVKNSSIFDLASLTKVFATTQCIMKLYDEGKLELDDTVVEYLPEFAQNEKGDITIRNLLLHNSGMPDYYTPKEGQIPGSIIDSIYARKKAYTTGTGMVYSCLNFITLMKVVEKVTGKQMYQYYSEQFAEPLGLKNTMFTPRKELKERIVPATPELKGTVHDPLARGLEGLSGNAGLFSTTGDLAVFCQLMLNKGEYGNKRFFSEQTVEKFTSPKNKYSSRALGWDTNVRGNKTCGSLFSSKAFGHTGYTGTSAWCDPEKNLFMVLLTNRVYPDDQASVYRMRTAVHDAVIMAYEKIPPQPTVQMFVRDSKRSLVLKWDDNSEIGPAEKTEVRLNYGEGFEVFGEYNSEKSKVSIDLTEIGKTDELISVNLINKYDDNKSLSSDIFSVRGDEKDVLVVDAQDELPSENKPLHTAVLYHQLALPSDVSFESCHSSQVDGAIELSDYKTVFWVASEDNTPNELFTEEHQEYLKNYFNTGGNIFVNGAEIGWAIGREGKSKKNKDFYNSFLKAEFLGDASNSYTVKGSEGTVFEDLEFEYGNKNSLYKVEYPDYIKAVNGGKLCLEYENNKAAGVFFKDVNNQGKMVYFGFPFETITTEENRKAVMNILFKFFE